MNIKDMDSFKNLELELKTLPSSANERSLYAPLINFFVPLAKEQLNNDNVIAVAEETGGNDEEKVGFPDITLRRKGNALGWVEVKLPDDSLTNQKFQNQFDRYKNAFQNFLITNLREWQLWQWNQDGKAILVKEILWNASSPAEGGNTEIADILIRFFEGSALEVRTPKQLALALARKAQLLSKQVEEIYDENDEESQLYKLKHTFQQTLIQDISEHQFANMVAETIAYSLFLARLEYENKHEGLPFTLDLADKFLPKNVPILKDLYDLVLKVSNEYIPIQQAAQLLVDQLNSADIERIRHKLTEHKPGEDPVIQFYEPFLTAYDPEERKDRGVYYTPKPVVDYIVRSVDWILKNKFDKPEGLADETVQILDPATGSGTFLMSAVQQVYANVKESNQHQGEDMVKRVFEEKVLQHILKHFYGFELLIAPYAVAHLKLTLELERMGFNFEQTYSDEDDENNRLKIYLANTLDDPNVPPQNLFGFDSISEESKKAQKVKKDEPVLAIFGNPPYSISSSNKGKWIEDEMKLYKEDVANERNIQLLSDDYAKFLRFCHWKIQKTGLGVISMITKNTYLSVSAFLGLRKKLLEYFDEIYILNLHGKQYEQFANGIIDENVFDIRVGVAIILLVKNNSKNDNYGHLYYKDIIGTRTEKFEVLGNSTLMNLDWEELPINSNKYFFEKKNFKAQDEYDQYISLGDLFMNTISGIKSGRDNFVSNSTENSLKKKLQSFVDSSEDDENLKKIFGLEDSTNLTVQQLKRKFTRIQDELFKHFCFKPFEKRTIYYDRSIIDRDRYNVMKNLLDFPNIGLAFKKSYTENTFQHAFVINGLTDINFLNGQTYITPLYLKNLSEQQSLIDLNLHNYNMKLINQICGNLGLNFTDRQADPISDLDPISIFYYIYAILYSPAYRIRYSEQLKTDFPKIPFTSDINLFKQLVKLGHELVNLHLLGENPFDNSKTILDESEKWNLQPKGENPSNLEDWKVTEVRYDPAGKRVYVNPGQYFEGVDKEVWEFMIGGYQVLDKWLKDRKKAERALSVDDLKHYMKIVVALRETIRIMKEIDETIPEWPIK